MLKNNSILNKSNPHHRKPKLLVFPKTESEIPSFEKSLANEIDRAIQNRESKINVIFAFPGRTQNEAQRLGKEFTTLLEQNLKDVFEKKDAVAPINNIPAL